MANLLERTISGKPITAEARTAPTHVKATDIPKVVCNHFPIKPWLPSSKSKRKPGMTGGNTKGKCTKPSNNDLPKNDFFANSQATATPGMQMISVQKTATLAESSSACISAGLKISAVISGEIKSVKLNDYSGLNYLELKILKPYFLKISNALLDCK